MSAPAGERPARRPTAPDGFVVVDKPHGLTSHDVVARMRRLAGTRKVGHAGTLDPMATGVLVVGIGRATRLLTYVVGADKEYLATVRLGVATSTEDAEGEVVSTADATAVGDVDVRTAAAALTGHLLQVPSAVSAIKVDGRRAYARVRAGEDVVLAARPVHVAELEVLAMRTDETEGVVVRDVDIRVVVSSGTYVRALARDLGDALGVGGHLTALRRTRVGGYRLDQARSLEELGRTPDDVPISVTSLADAARATFPVRDLTEREARALGYGQAVDASARSGSGSADGASDEVVAAIAPDGTLVALLQDRDGSARPVLVLAPA